MGQLVSDVTEILDYKQSKNQAKSQRKEILAQMASDDTEKTNLIKMRDDGDIVPQTVRTKQMSVYETAGASPCPTYTPKLKAVVSGSNVLK